METDRHTHTHTDTHTHTQTHKPSTVTLAAHARRGLIKDLCCVELVRIGYKMGYLVEKLYGPVINNYKRIMQQLQFG